MTVNRMQIEELVPKTTIADLLLSFKNKAEAECLLYIMAQTIANDVTRPIYRALYAMVRDWK